MDAAGVNELGRVVVTGKIGSLDQQVRTCRSQGFVSSIVQTIAKIIVQYSHGNSIGTIYHGCISPTLRLIEIHHKNQSHPNDQQYTHYSNESRPLVAPNPYFSSSFVVTGNNSIPRGHW
eukprot:scaffold32886_cov50-Attheya_sp.AAC.1